MNTKLAIAAVMSLALAGALAAPAFAQDNTSGMSDDMDMVDPAAVDYPFAAPGGLDMYHWKNYEQKDLEPGSAGDARFTSRRHRMVREHNRMRDDDEMAKRDGLIGSDTMAANATGSEAMMYHRSMMDDDDMDMAPASVGYPFAAPGALHMYHWKSFEKNDLVPGSAEDARMDQMHASMMAAHDRTKSDDDAAMRDGSGSMEDGSVTADDRGSRAMRWDPAPVSYPFAAPGSLDMWHWRSYQEKELVPGSVNEERTTQRRRMRMQGRKDGNSTTNAQP